jgi:hypothetical protein
MMQSVIKHVPALTELTWAFNVTSTTLRNWSAEFADHLSPAANPSQPSVTHLVHIHLHL